MVAGSAIAVAGVAGRRTVVAAGTVDIDCLIHCEIQKACISPLHTCQHTVVATLLAIHVTIAAILLLAVLAGVRVVALIALRHKVTSIRLSGLEGSGAGCESRSGRPETAALLLWLVVAQVHLASLLRQVLVLGSRIVFP